MATPTFLGQASAEGTTVSSLSVAFTIPAGTNYIEVDTDNSDNGMTVTGVTYNSVALTLIPNASHAYGGQRSYMWYLLSPTIDGTPHNAVMTLSGVENYVSMAIRAYSTVNQSVPHGTVVKTANNSTSISVDVASATGELVVDLVHVYNVTPGVGAGQTQRSAKSGTRARLGTSDEPGAATVTMSWTTNQAAILIAVPLKPTADAPPSGKFLQMF